MCTLAWPARHAGSVPGRAQPLRERWRRGHNYSHPLRSEAAWCEPVQRRKAKRSTRACCVLGTAPGLSRVLLVVRLSGRAEPAQGGAMLALTRGSGRRALGPQPHAHQLTRRVSFGPAAASPRLAFRAREQPAGARTAPLFTAAAAVPPMSVAAANAWKASSGA